MPVKLKSSNGFTLSKWYKNGEQQQPQGGCRADNEHHSVQNNNNNNNTNNEKEEEENKCLSVKSWCEGKRERKKEQKKIGKSKKLPLTKNVAHNFLMSLPHLAFMLWLPLMVLWFEKLRQNSTLCRVDVI